MENKIEVSLKLSKGELLQRQYDQKMRELLIARTRANVVKSQIVRVYEVLENIRFDFISDTAFREKIVKAKRNLESALNDFLLSDIYWEGKIKGHNHMTPNEYAEYLRQPVVRKGKNKA